MMKKIISLVLITSVLGGCSIFRTHKMDITQGNVITQQEVSQLHRGMSEQQVKDIMGTPILVNLFTPNRIDYIYTYQQGYAERKDQRVICIFRHGRLDEIVTSL